MDLLKRMIEKISKGRDSFRLCVSLHPLIRQSFGYTPT